MAARTPGGVPICGALKIQGTSFGYPIVDCVARVSSDLARRYADWLRPFGLLPPENKQSREKEYQQESTVESFGFQWQWRGVMRTEADLKWRVAERFKIKPDLFQDKVILDAGSGAGDQSRWLLEHGARVISVDLSSAIDVTARKLRMNGNWFGIQGDIARLPLATDYFDLIYCEGVIQHTQDSALTVEGLCQKLKPDGLILATHYGKPIRSVGRIKLKFQEFIRRRISRLNPHTALWVCGNLAALAFVPILGFFVRKSGLAIHYALMPDFISTWTNTYDFYGLHAFQRYISSDEFWAYFDRTNRMEQVFRDGTLVVARKMPG